MFSLAFTPIKTPPSIALLLLNLHFSMISEHAWEYTAPPSFVASWCISMLLFMISIPWYDAKAPPHLALLRIKLHITIMMVEFS